MWQGAIYALVTAGSLLVTTAAILSLENSRKSCVALHAALLRIYQDTDVLKYFPPDAERAGNTRLVLSLVVVAGTGILAVAIPLMEYLW